MQNDPTYKENYKRLMSLSSAKELQRRKTEFEEKQPKLDASKPSEPVKWEGSEPEIAYKAEIEELKSLIASHRDLISSLSAELQYSNLYKSGGSLSKQDRIDLEREKARLRNAQKDIELTYKAILHNNELMQKALIKIFK